MLSFLYIFLYQHCYIFKIFTLAILLEMNFHSVIYWHDDQLQNLTKQSNLKLKDHDITKLKQLKNGEAFSSRNTQKNNFLSSQREFEPMTFQILVGRPNHWTMGTRGEQSHFWKVMSSTPVGVSANSSYEYFGLRFTL